MSESIFANGAEYTFRTVEEIKDLIKEADDHYAAGRAKEGDAVRTKLKFTALKVK
jgi:hypothetical protein